MFNSLITALASSTLEISETTKNKGHGEIKMLHANATTKDEILIKLKDLCKNSDYVHIAARYCKYKKGGKYMCKKHWKCKRRKFQNTKKTLFCTGTVHHSCMFAKRNGGTGEVKNVTIDIVLEKQNKITDKSSEVPETDDTVEAVQVCINL